jgi:hypothetical protein
VVAADLPVHRIVTRRDLDRPGPELRLDALVLDDGKPTPDDREHGLLSDELPVALVPGMDGDRHVGEDRRRPDRRDRNVP